MSFTVLLRRCVILSLLPMLSLALSAQVTLTGAAEFSTNSRGFYHQAQFWNTLGGDSYYNLWLALDPDATSPVNGPSDAEAGISIPLVAGESYKYYIFGQVGVSTDFAFSGLNLFFDGNNSSPGISVFGALNNAAFLPDGGNTVALQGTPVTGAGTAAYSADGVVVLVTSFTWETPATPPGDVCLSFSFAPGSVPVYFGSFSLHVFPGAALSLDQNSGSPLTVRTLTGSGFAPSEKVNLYAGAALLGTANTSAAGSFSATAREPQYPHGSMGFYALGLSSGRLGFANLSVTPGMIAFPGSVAPGGSAAVQGLGFGSGETVDVYLDAPRQLLGTVTANAVGSFTGAAALTVIIPANASSGLNAVVGVGQTTGAIGIGGIEVK